MKLVNLFILISILSLKSAEASTVTNPCALAQAHASLALVVSQSKGPLAKKLIEEFRLDHQVDEQSEALQAEVKELRDKRAGLDPRLNEAIRLQAEIDTRHSALQGMRNRFFKSHEERFRDVKENFFRLPENEQIEIIRLLGLVVSEGNSATAAQSAMAEITSLRSALVEAGRRGFRVDSLQFELAETLNAASILDDSSRSLLSSGVSTHHGYKILSVTDN